MVGPPGRGAPPARRRRPRREARGEGGRPRRGPSPGRSGRLAPVQGRGLPVRGREIRRGRSMALAGRRLAEGPPRTPGPGGDAPGPGTRPGGGHPAAGRLEVVLSGRAGEPGPRLPRRAGHRRGPMAPRPAPAGLGPPGGRRGPVLRHQARPSPVARLAADHGRPAPRGRRGPEDQPRRERHQGEDGGRPQVAPGRHRLGEPRARSRSPSRSSSPGSS